MYGPIAPFRKHDGPSEPILLDTPGVFQYRTARSSRLKPPGKPNGQVAQLVEHGTENPGVGSSILPLPTTFSLIFPSLV